MRLAVALVLAAALAARPALADEGESARASPGVIAVGGFLLYYDSEGPLSYVSMTPGDLPQGALDAGEVKARRCQYGLSIPITASIRPTSLSGAKGDGGLRRVLETLRQEKPRLAGVYDVKLDMHHLSLLGIFRRLCTELTARGFTLPPST